MERFEGREKDGDRETRLERRRRSAAGSKKSRRAATPNATNMSPVRSHLMTRIIPRLTRCGLFQLPPGASEVIDAFRVSESRLRSVVEAFKQEVEKGLSKDGMVKLIH